VIRALRLVLDAAGRRAGLLGAHARLRAAHVAALSVFATAGAVFLLTLATVALARWLGLMPALGIMAGLCALGCAVVLVLMRGEARAHAAALAAQRRDEAQLLQAAALAAVPPLRRGGGLAAAALSALALGLLAGVRARRPRAAPPEGHPPRRRRR
jgi:hypothetical protein